MFGASLVVLGDNEDTPQPPNACAVVATLAVGVRQRAAAVGIYNVASCEFDSTVDRRAVRLMNAVLDAAGGEELFGAIDSHVPSVGAMVEAYDCPGTGDACPSHLISRQGIVTSVNPSGTVLVSFFSPDGNPDQGDRALLPARCLLPLNADGSIPAGASESHFVHGEHLHALAKLFGTAPVPTIARDQLGPAIARDFLPQLYVSPAKNITFVLNSSDASVGEDAQVGHWVCATLGWVVPPPTPNAPPGAIPANNLEGDAMGETPSSPGESSDSSSPSSSPSGGSSVSSSPPGPPKEAPDPGKGGTPAGRSPSVASPPGCGLSPTLVSAASPPKPPSATAPGVSSPPKPTRRTSRPPRPPADDEAVRAYNQRREDARRRMDGAVTSALHPDEPAGGASAGASSTPRERSSDSSPAPAQPPPEPDPGGSATPGHSPIELSQAPGTDTETDSDGDSPPRPRRLGADLDTSVSNNGSTPTGDDADPRGLRSPEKGTADPTHQPSVSPGKSADHLANRELRRAENAAKLARGSSGAHAEPPVATSASPEVQRKKSLRLASRPTV